MVTHPVSAAADQTLAATKKGLKAILQTANGSLLTDGTAGIATLHLPAMSTETDSLTRRSSRAIRGRNNIVTVGTRICASANLLVDLRDRVRTRRWNVAVLTSKPG